MMRPTPRESAAEPDSSERWTKLERELLDQSAARIRTFEQRLQHEWEALRRLHEEPVQALRAQTDELAARAARGDAGSLRAMRRLVAALALGLAASVGFNVLLWVRLGSVSRRADAAGQAARAAQDELRTATTALSTQVRMVSSDAAALRVRTERVLQVLAAADVRRFTLLGRTAAPAASGQALWSRTRGLVIDAARLPPPASGEAQQAWLLTTRGSISLGFLTPDAQGRVSASFDTPPDMPGTVTGVAVTGEPAGGSGSPGSRVLVASNP